MTVDGTWRRRALAAACAAAVLAFALLAGAHAVRGSWSGQQAATSTSAHHKGVEASVVLHRQPAPAAHPKPTLPDALLAAALLLSALAVRGTAGSPRRGFRGLLGPLLPPARSPPPGATPALVRAR
jgi:hypothetical protein